ncbi:TrkH family potassium uptake protein [bacterium]|nr:TrkH family potassium uptake protein [bacterium]
MEYKNILKLLSIIGSVLGLFFLLDVLVGVIYDELYFKLLIFDLFFITINLLIWFLLAKHQINLKIRESILAVNLLWILLGVAGAMPLYFYSNISFSSAIFEAISGFTTTGATIYADVESLPVMILFHRSLMHWIGGMGIIILGVGLLSVINPTGSLSLFKAESTGISMEKLTPKIKDTALSLWGVYIILTLLDLLLLKLLGMNWFDAINHAFSTISTGGFSTKNSSIAYFNNDGIIWITTIFMLLAAVNFLAHLKFFYYRDSHGYKNEEFKWFLIIFLFLGTLLTFIHMDVSGDTFYDAAKHSFFTISSVLTTTGFATINYDTWGHAAVGVIIIAMLIGGNAGSTAGGIKVIRYVVMGKTIMSELKRVVHPNTFASVFVDGVKLNSNIISATFVFFFLYLMTIVLVSLYIYARGLDTMTAISGALAIVGNIGPGFSLVGPEDNFGFFSDIDKIVLSLGMIIGRLEFYTVFVLFTTSFWRKF